MRPPTVCRRVATCSGTSATPRASRLTRSSCSARASPARDAASRAICTCASCGRWTGCGRRSCWARTSYSFWAGSRVDLAARLVEVAGRRRPLPEEEVVQRVGVVEVAVGEARLLQLMERERAEPVPGLRVLRLEVARLSIEPQRARIVLRERGFDPERLRVERVE